ncbi:unnamed protein product [Caenorhabditis brenneri]
MACFLADWKASYFSKLEQLDEKQVSGRDFFRAIPFCVLIILTRFVPLASSEFSEEFLMELVDPFQFSATIMVVSWFSEKIIIQKLLLGTSEAELFGLYSTSLLVAHGATALTVFSVTHALIMEGPSSNNFVFSIITMSLFTVFFWFLHIQEYPLTLKRENPWKALVILQRICFFLVFIYCFYSTFFENESYDPEFSPEYVMYLKVKAIIITGATLLYFSKIYSPISADFVLLLIGRLENKKVEMAEAPRSAPQKKKKRENRKVSFHHEE